jgi:ethanolamine utilization protein EutP (predicted NTPase)
MPLTYVIDKPGRLVTSTASGVLTYEDIATHQERLKSDPDFDPTFDQLFDGTTVTKIELTAAEVQTVARQRLFAAGSRQAFATSNEFAYGMARMFEIYRETSGTGRLVHVFDGIEAAREWLQPIRVRKKA